MLMRWGREVEIEDLRNHPAEMVMSLRKLLERGARVSPDPKRTGFYEVESGKLVFYIYASPALDKILLLATWPREASLVACCCPAA
jgi:hypothetical protein